MDETAVNIIERETALADFDHAREDFEAAFGQVPDEALHWKPEGDDYSIGDLLPHVTSVLKGYLALIEMMKLADFQEVRKAASDEQAVLFERYRPSWPDPLKRVDSRRAALEQMEAAHDELAAKLRDMAYKEYSRQAPVYYPGSEEAYPTRAADIIGWVTEHYREHVQHVGGLLEGWKKDEKRKT